jgi:hypothetical protein
MKYSPARRGCKVLVSRQERTGEPLGESHVRCVECGEIGAERPDAREKGLVPVSTHGEPRQKRNRESTAVLRNRAAGGLASQDLTHFDVDEMRRVQRFTTRAEESLLDRCRRGRPAASAPARSMRHTLNRMLRMSPSATT